ncbi:uncharacterized protein UTRI_01146_B [Ustilago trichophora]|uniref:Uncharacterized protein n=1 Tax=Ustilago trichophora TaxID=86804 RepID=A0A5C3DT81_9BASI|nr:uncharacterized protein UTRI_01146_B [Ustilago trichophora]
MERTREPLSGYPRTTKPAVLDHVVPWPSRRRWLNATTKIQATQFKSEAEQPRQLSEGVLASRGWRCVVDSARGDQIRARPLLSVSTGQRRLCSSSLPHSKARDNSAYRIRETFRREPPTRRNV